MEVLFHIDAEAEFETSVDWYENQRPGLGIEFYEEVTNAIVRIVQNPERPVNLEDSEIRQFLLPRFPFTICYEATVEQIHIVAVAHQKRKPGYWSDRLPDD